MKRRTAAVVSGLVAGAVVLGGAGAVLAGTAPDVSRNSGGVGSPGYSTTMSGYSAAGTMGYQSSSGPMTISPTQATRIATHELQQNQAGATTEAPEQFPGYYTVHILKSGMVMGMLSVNGYSGQVWYHTWHGTLISMKDLHA